MIADPRALPIPPVDMIMPQVPQTVFIVANSIVCLIALAFAERMRRKSGSAVGYWLLLAGAATVINEPAVDILGLCWFAARGSIPLFKAWGVTIPLFMLPVYCWYVGGQAMIALAAIRRGSTVAQIFRLYALFAVVNVALEVPGLNMGIYAYYGNQPFEFLGFPFWWPICNALMPIVMACIVHFLLPHLKGVRVLLIILVGPMAAGVTNGAIAIPVWVALNSGMPAWAAHVASLVSLVLGLTVAFLVTRLVATDAHHARSPHAASFG